MKLIFLFIISLIIRLIVIFFTKNINNYDLQSYLLIGEKTFKGINIYPQFALNHYPYIPLFLYLEALAFFLRHYLNPAIFLKLVINFFDLSNGYLIYWISKKDLKKTALYLLNPVSILIFSFHGQFDALPLFFLIFSFHLLKQRKELQSAILYSIAILLKTWPIFFTFIFFKSLKRKKLIFLIPIIITTIIFIYITKFHSSFFEIIKTILSYRSLFDIWGAGLLIKLIFFNNQAQPPIFIQKILLYFFLISLFLKSLHLSYQKKDIFEKTANLLFFFYFFTFGFSLQYLSWLIPFLALNNYQLFFKIKILLLLFFYLLINYLSWIMPNSISHHFMITVILFVYFNLLFLIFEKNRASSSL